MPMLGVSHQYSISTVNVQSKLRAMQTAIRFCVSCKQHHALFKHPVVLALLAKSSSSNEHGVSRPLRGAAAACAAVGGGGGGGALGGGGGDGGDGNSSTAAEDQSFAAARQGDEEVLLLDVSGMGVVCMCTCVCQPTPTVTTTSFTPLTGMKCGGCVSRVKDLLEEQPEVAAATVNLATETAMVRVAPEALSGVADGKVEMLMGLGKKLAQV